MLRGQSYFITQLLGNQICWDNHVLRDLKMQKGNSSVFCKLLTGTFFPTMSKDSHVTNFRKKSNHIWQERINRQARNKISDLSSTTDPYKSGQLCEFRIKVILHWNKSSTFWRSHNCSCSILPPDENEYLLLPIWKLTMGYLALWAGMKPHLHANSHSSHRFQSAVNFSQGFLVFHQIWDLTYICLKAILKLPVLMLEPNR